MQSGCNPSDLWPFRVKDGRKNNNAAIIFVNSKNRNAMKSKIYQLVSFVNAWNKRTKQWESLRSISKVYVGAEGLKSALIEFENETKEFEFLTQQHLSKHGEKRGKVELHEPHVHNNGSLAYWGDKVIKTHNPCNI